MNIYLATNLERPKENQSMAECLRVLGHKVRDGVIDIGPIYDEEGFKNELEKASDAGDLLEGHLKWLDMAMFIFMPSDLALFEIARAIKLKKKVVALDLTGKNYKKGNPYGDLLSVFENLEDLTQFLEKEDKARESTDCDRRA